MINITLKGNVPSKKNSKQIISIHGRPMIISSKNYTDWHKQALIDLKLAQIKPLQLETTKCITCSFYSPNRRKYDLSNKFESIADLLVDYGLLKDDNYEVLPRVIINYMGVDEEKIGRVEIQIDFTN